MQGFFTTMGLSVSTLIEAAFLQVSFLKAAILLELRPVEPLLRANAAANDMCTDSSHYDEASTYIIEISRANEVMTNIVNTGML